MLVKWKNFSDFEATWEPIDAVKEQFHEFPFEGKVNVEGGGIDGSAHVVSRPPINASRPLIKFYYTRKMKHSFQRAGSD